ncbi:MAG TPA: multiheme c-type cytochrome, partial [Thermoanaerobaculia bacterium]
MRSNRLFLPLGAAALLLALAAYGAASPRPQEGTPQPAAQPAATQGYAGSDVCMACHTEVAEHLEKTPHGSDAFERMAAQGCESCHGPAAAHAEDPDNPALQPSMEKRTPKQQSAVCQSCHDGRGQFFWHGSVHAKRGLS